jgi:hypothetical protein
LIEFYCPGCGTMVETEYLPPGHPITNDIELDIDAMKAKYLAGDPSGDAGGASGGGSGGGSGTTGEGGVR